MPLIELIRQRRSVRSYDGRTVEREKIELCLEAARLAPSASNSQPWKFIVVDDPSLKDRMAQAAFKGVYSLSNFAAAAPVIVAAVADKAGFASRAGSLVRNTSFYRLDMGIAGEHFILEAADLGLGTCWIGWFDERSVKSVLGIPRNRRVEYLISLGYPVGEMKSGGHKRVPLTEMSSFNSWRGF